MIKYYCDYCGAEIKDEWFTVAHIAEKNIFRKETPPSDVHYHAYCFSKLNAQVQADLKKIRMEAAEGQETDDKQIPGGTK